LLSAEGKNDKLNKKVMEKNLEHSDFNFIRDQSVKEEKRDIKSNDHAAFNVIRDHAVKEEKRDIKSNNHAAAPSTSAKTNLARESRGISRATITLP
jgi:hypothetical protein